MENPPPMNEADKVAKITIDPKDFPATAYWERFEMPRPARIPMSRTANKYEKMMALVM